VTEVKQKLIPTCPFRSLPSISTGMRHSSTGHKHLDQSCFTPIFPTRRNPNAPVRNTRIINASKAQKTALYPSMRAFGDDLSTSSEAAVIDSEMTEVIVNPTDVPSCAQVLNTAPPRACVRVGNTAEMISRPTVKRMLVHKSWKTCVEVCQRGVTMYSIDKRRKTAKSITL
jgi:hypothetical protein